MMRYTPQPADDQPTPTDTPSTPNLVQNIVSAITDIFDPPETNAPTTSVATVSKPVTNVTTDTDTTNQSPSADQNTPNIWPFILGGIGFIGIIIFALLRKKDKK
jgi:hypothetical protein